MASHDDQLWNEVNGILEARPGWSVQESPTPGVGPYWAFTSHGTVERSIFIDGAAVHLYEEDTDREVRFDTTGELVAWLDANRTLGPAPTTPKSDPLHWR
jgi:hypothetical protein